MKKATISVMALGTARQAAKRAAAIIALLQNRDTVSKKQLIADVEATLQAYGEQNPKLNSADLESLGTVSARLHEVFAAQDTASAAGLLNIILDDYAQTPRLSAHNNSAWHLHIDSSDHAPWSEWFVTSSALALAVLLAEKQHNPGGLCASSTCKRPFIDQGKGGGRSYCSPRCATRERVATYRNKGIQPA